MYILATYNFKSVKTVWQEGRKGEGDNERYSETKKN
jgi:hypothetical protein